MADLRSSILHFLRWPIHIRAIESLVRKFVVGSRFDSLLGRVPPKHADYPNQTFREFENNGVKMSVDLSDLVGWYGYWGFTDIPRRKLYSLISPGATVVDIGANIGEVTLNAARLVGEAGHVYSFEPSRVNFGQLSANRDLNTFSNITLVNKGLGKEAGRLEMFIPDAGNRGMTRVVSSEHKDEPTEYVEITTLDLFAEENGLDRIDLIKIDVEGFEMNVLAGAEKTLRDLRPKLFLEVIDRLLKGQGSSRQSVIDLLSSLDYDLFHAASGEAIDPVHGINDEQFDMVAIARKS
jgi:FkbM family methyltransferase